MVKISDINLPVIFKNQLLFKAGYWNSLSFSNEMVNKSVANTKWSKLNRRLYLKHENAYDIEKWKGNVENIKNVTNNGVAEVRGDIALWDANEALQILHGEKPIALSADIEYNDDGIMFFTGFALEADPGVRDHEMFLSDAVKNELNGYYKASFSNQIDTDNAKPTENTSSQPNNIDTTNTQSDTQSAERRLINNNQQMENTKPNQPVDDKGGQNVVDLLAKELSDSKDQIKEIKQTLENQSNSINEIKSQSVPNEGTVVNKPIATETVDKANNNTENVPIQNTQVMDIQTVQVLAKEMAKEIVEGIKPEPTSVTTQELAQANVPTDEKTVDQIVDYFDKTNGQRNI